jgi:hypothetical protein
MPRSDAQRRFDALRTMFERAATQPADTRTPEPLVDLVVDIHTLDCLVNAGSTALPTEPDVWRQRCGTLDVGPTDPANGGPGCPRHNRFKSKRGYIVRRDPDGTCHTHRPDGTELA